MTVRAIEVYPHGWGNNLLLRLQGSVRFRHLARHARPPFPEACRRPQQRIPMSRPPSATLEDRGGRTRARDHLVLERPLILPTRLGGSLAGAPKPGLMRVLGVPSYTGGRRAPVGGARREVPVPASTASVLSARTRAQSRMVHSLGGDPTTWQSSML